MNGNTTRKPSILMLAAPVPPPYGGIAKYLQTAIPFLVDNGYDVHAVPPEGEHAPVALKKVGGAEFTVHRLVEPTRDEALLFITANLCTLAPLLLRFGRAALTSPRFALRSLYWAIAWCMTVEKVRETTPFTIIHAFDLPWAQGAAALWGARKYGARSVVSTFGEVVPHRKELEQFDEVSRGFVALSHFVLQQSDAATSMTNHCLNQVRHVGINPADLELVRFVVGMHPFETANGAEVRSRFAPNDEPLLLFVGQVRPRKGPHVLVSAMPAIRERHPQSRLLIVGSGPSSYRAELEAQARRLGVDQAIRFIGPVSDDHLPEFFAGCDLFIFPTLTAIECLGLVFIQAMFARKPVIATRIAGAPEVIRPGVDGELVPPGDPEALAGKIITLLDADPEVRNRMGSSAFGRVSDLFNESEVLSDLTSVYERLLTRDG